MVDQPKIILSNELVQAIGDYLITRPYREVAILIGGLQKEVQAGIEAANAAALSASAFASANGGIKPEPEKGNFSPTGDLQ